MLAKIAPTSTSFHRLADYLINGPKGCTPSPDRVAWVAACNLPSDDPELAAKVMAATAALSARTRKAVYHLMIAWGVGEHPGVEAMQAIALETLRRAGLGDHEALLVGHADTAHAHVHLMVNRVHPVSGKAWSTSHDFARFDAIMRELSEAYGYAYAPAHAFNWERTYEQRKGPDTPATYAARRGAPTKRLQWSRGEAVRFGERLNGDLPSVATLEDLADTLADYGLELAAKGGGHVVGDGTSYTKLSRLGLVVSAKGDVQRRRQPESVSPAGSVFEVDGVDIARAFAAWGVVDQSVVQAAVVDAMADRAARHEHALVARMLARAASVTSLTQASQSRRRVRPTNRSCAPERV